MKTVVVVNLFVLVACLQLQANGAKIKNASGCKLEPEHREEACQLITCDENSGDYSVQICDDVIDNPYCPEGTVLDWLNEDLSKPFPECCERAYCRLPRIVKYAPYSTLS